MVVVFLDWHPLRPAGHSRESRNSADLLSFAEWIRLRGNDSGFEAHARINWSTFSYLTYNEGKMIKVPVKITSAEHRNLGVS